MRRTTTIFMISSLLAPIASADLLSEARLGVMQHNICVSDCNNANKEDGPNINGEIVFNSPDFLDLLFSPHPYVMGSVNTAGKTSFGGFGLHWNWDFAEGWSLEPGVGYVVHDGSLKSPYPQGDPQGDAYTEENVLLGSSDLFRTSLGLNKDLTEKWGVQILYEHLSHGQILGDGRNQGLDNIGVRVTYTFGD